MRVITKERLEEIRDFDTCVTLEESAEMARQLLAGMDQEPVHQACKEAGVWVDIEPGDVASLKANGEQVRALYAAPQLPQPAVQNMHHDAKCDLFRPQVVNGVFVPRHCDCSAAKVQGAEPVSQPYTLHDGWVAVPVEMTPEQMRAVHLNSELGAYAAANLTGAYSLFREFWDVAVNSVPNQEVK